ncbi:hypothetical protein [Dermatophilus congolensis]|nr:hypothetical protein [Dermatophilus congolensis]MBO3130177.1 hypothetical protein [Dermatophilus congolensis]MBO3131196.1 hypothetical protein [Dermatophilus congolensis]MBO3134648.1 hypothetical protein [Dermatophilus congolensis]MBO3136885.1 hypothetical protein [Dermatophilus congolensis]MBO3139129.1 hypothetical protein [Dermatophilus congolensis]
MTPKDHKKKYEYLSYILSGLCILLSSRYMIQAQEGGIIQLIGYAAVILGASSFTAGAFLTYKLHRNKTSQQHL